MIVAGLPRHHLVDQPARGLKIEREDLRFQKRGLDILTFAGDFTLEERDQNAKRGEETRRHIGDRGAGANGPLSRQAGDRHQPAHALRDLIEARALAIRPVLPVSRDAGIDDARIDRAQFLVADFQAMLHVGPEILDHHIGRLRHAQERVAAGFRFQVECDAALVAMQVLEIAGMARAADRVAGLEPLRGLDLDHVGAPIRELAHAGRPRTHAGKIENGETGERL